MASFRKRNDKWEYRIKYKDIYGKTKEKSKGGFKTKKEAQIAAAKVETKIAENTFVQDSNVRFEQFVIQWLEVYKKPHVKPNTYLRLERTVRNHLIPAFGHLKLNEITRTQYQTWINEQANKYTKGTLRSWNSTMRSIFDHACVDLNLMEKNPASKTKIPYKEEAEKEISFFEQTHLKKLLEHIKNTPHQKYQNSIQYYVLFTFLARTGLRIGEALALTWDDIDFIAGEVTVNKTVVFLEGNVAVTQSPKTKKSNRTIRLDKDTLRLLKKHRINRKEVHMRYPRYEKPNEDLVFYNQNGTHLRVNVTRDFLKEKCKEAGVPVLSLHALRHTHAVHLLESGANIKYVSERLGHATINMTANTYLHISKKIEDDAIKQYETYLENL